MQTTDIFAMVVIEKREGLHLGLKVKNEVEAVLAVL